MRTLGGLLVLFSALVAGCGTSGGEPAQPANLFVGEYWAFHLNASDHYTMSQLPVLYTLWGTADSDGQGAHAEDLEGATGPPPLPYGGTYVIDPDHTFRGSHDGLLLLGGMSTYGRCVVAHGWGLSSYARLAVYFTTLGAFDDASLDGIYHMVGIERAPYPGGNTLFDCKATFDGAGGYAATSFVRNRATAVSAHAPATSLEYSVEAGGRLRLDDLDGDDDLTGGILSGNELAMAAGGIGIDQDNLLVALIEAGSGLSNTTFEGEYWILLFRRQVDTYRTRMGVISADGAGGCSFSGAQNAEGEMRLYIDFDATYTVGEDGTLTLTLDDGTVLSGGLSPSGKYFALGGGVNEGDDAVFAVGIPR